MLRRLVRIFLPRHKLVYHGQQPDGQNPVVFVANHARAYGPIAMCATLTRLFRPWVNAQVCTFAAAPGYIRSDFWHPRTRIGKLVLRLFSYLLTVILVPILKSTRPIAVHRDHRLSQTLISSTRALGAGEDLVIFPETDDTFSQYNNAFASGFLALGKTYFRRFQKPLAFLPTYISLRKREIHIAPPFYWSPDISLPQLAHQLEKAMSDLAKIVEDGLPPLQSLR